MAAFHLFLHLLQSLWLLMIRTLLDFVDYEWQSFPPIYTKLWASFLALNSSPDLFLHFPFCFTSFPIGPSFLNSSFIIPMDSQNFDLPLADDHPSIPLAACTSPLLPENPLLMHLLLLRVFHMPLFLKWRRRPPNLTMADRGTLKFRALSPGGSP